MCRLNSFSIPSAIFSISDVFLIQCYKGGGGGDEERGRGGGERETDRQRGKANQITVIKVSLKHFIFFKSHDAGSYNAWRQRRI